MQDLHIIIPIAAATLLLSTVAILIVSRSRHNRRLSQMAEWASLRKPKAITKSGNTTVILG